MTNKTKPIALRIGAAGLAISLVASSSAAAMTCADGREMAALRAASLRQELMVAALTCHQADSFNRFVVSYREQFRDSDHVLLAFFEREGSGEDGYNAYKTRIANDYSLRSLSDPYFCGTAERQFRTALEGNPSLMQLATDEAANLRTGFAACTKSADARTIPTLSGRQENVAEMNILSGAPAAGPMHQVQGPDGHWYLVPSN